MPMIVVVTGDSGAAAGVAGALATAGVEVPVPVSGVKPE